MGRRTDCRTDLRRPLCPGWPAHVGPDNERGRQGDGGDTGPELRKNAVETVLSLSPVANVTPNIFATERCERPRRTARTISLRRVSIPFFVHERLQEEKTF